MILVVGGAGYVGSVLVRRLLEDGYRVRVLDNLTYGNQGLVEILDQIDFVEADMREVPDSAFAGVDAVINVGGISNDPTADLDHELNMEVNFTASVEICRRARFAGAGRYIYASSCSVYDGLAGAPCKEDAEALPHSAYTESKWRAEKVLLAEFPEMTVILRKGTVHGFSPRMRYDLLLNTMVRDALSKGRVTVAEPRNATIWRPVVSVHDVASAYQLLLNATRVEGKIFNCVEANLTLTTLGNLVAAMLDVPIDFTETDRARNYRADGRALRHTTGWEPEMGLMAAVDEMLAQIPTLGYTDWSNPRYYNLETLRLQREVRNG